MEPESNFARARRYQLRARQIRVPRQRSDPIIHVRNIDPLRRHTRTRLQHLRHPVIGIVRIVFDVIHTAIHTHRHRDNIARHIRIIVECIHRTQPAPTLGHDIQMSISIVRIQILRRRVTVHSPCAFAWIL